MLRTHEFRLCMVFNFRHLYFICICILATVKRRRRHSEDAVMIRVYVCMYMKIRNSVGFVGAACHPRLNTSDAGVACVANAWVICKGDTLFS